MNEKLAELATQAGLFWTFSPAYEKCLEHFAELVRQDERELCAKVCEKYCGAWDDNGYALVQAIRARGDKHD